MSVAMTSDKDRLATVFLKRRILVITIISLVIIVPIIYVLAKPGGEVDKYHRPFRPDEMYLDFGFATSKPYFDFINPDNANFMRMFYSGQLVSEKDSSKSSADYLTKINMFTLDSFSAKHCVPFKATRNRTVQICIHDPEVDQMISSHIRDNAVWEADQVETMRELMQGDDNRSQRSTAFFTDVGGSTTDRQYDRNQKHARRFKSTVIEKDSDYLSSAHDRTTGNGAAISLVDVGCNIGVYSLSAASVGHEVLAIDPVRDSLVLLAHSLHLANLTSRVTLLLNAVSDQRGPVEVHVNPGNIGGSSVVHISAKDSGALKRKGAGLENLRRVERDISIHSDEHNARTHGIPPLANSMEDPVQSKNRVGSKFPDRISNTRSQNSTAGSRDNPVWAVCLDDLVPHVRTNRVFLKLDIEGWEARALHCAGKFFQEVDVRYVLMEWLFHRKSHDGIFVISFLTRNGFLPYDYIKQGTVLRPEKYYSWPDNVLWGKR